MAIKFFSNPSTIAQFIAFIFSISLLFNKATGFWRLFPLFLGITVLIEAIGVYYRYVLVQSNHPFFNFILLVEVLFYSFLFYKFSIDQKNKKWVLIALALMLLAFLFETYKITFAKYHGVFRELLSLFVVIFSCFYYLSLFKNDEITNPLTHPSFWIVTGLFIYYFGSSVMFAFGIHGRTNETFYRLIIGCLNCIFYGSWIIAFIQCKKSLHKQ